MGAFSKPHPVKGRQYLSLSDKPPKRGKGFQVPVAAHIGYKARGFDDYPKARGEVPVPAHPYAVHGDAALVRPQEAADALHQHGLAAAVIAHHPGDLPRRN